MGRYESDTYDHQKHSRTPSQLRKQHLGRYQILIFWSIQAEKYRPNHEKPVWDGINLLFHVPTYRPNIKKLIWDGIKSETVVCDTEELLELIRIVSCIQSSSSCDEAKVYESLEIAVESMHALEA